MTKEQGTHFKRDFWIVEADKYYRQPYLRLEKCAKLINTIARNNQIDLLDVGCGPATLEQLLAKNIHYYGIDLAIHTPKSNLLEVDIAESPIRFGDMSFDIVVATGLFEYMGGVQEQKLSEIRRILKQGGRFIVSYTNFNHVHALVDYAPYNNILSIAEFIHALESFFRVEQYFPTYHNWNGTEPRKKWSYQIQKNVTVNVPFLSPRFAVSYFFVCSPKKPGH